MRVCNFALVSLTGEEEVEAKSSCPCWKRRRYVRCSAFTQGSLLIGGGAGRWPQCRVTLSPAGSRSHSERRALARRLRAGVPARTLAPAACTVEIALSVPLLEWE